MAFDFLSLTKTVSDLPGVDLIPGAGIFKTGVNLLSGLLKGGVPDHERGDLVTLSTATGLTQQQAADLSAWDADRNHEYYDATVKKYANNPASIAPLIPAWNAAHPDKPRITLLDPQVPPVVAQAPAPVAAAPAFVAQSLTSTPIVAPVAAGGPLDGLGKAVLGGAQQGASDWFMKTPAGMQAKSDGAMSWAKDNVLILCAAGVALGLLIYRAFIKK
jgi:hypothetical protein